MAKSIKKKFHSSEMRRYVCGKKKILSELIASLNPIISKYHAHTHTHTPTTKIDEPCVCGVDFFE